MQGDFKLGDWVISPSLNSISSQEKTTKVEPKAMQVLVCLARHEGFVSKEQLIAEVWPGTFVSEDVLPGAISALRKALNDNARNPRTIETIHKSGYRLLPPVEWSGNGNGAAIAAVPAPAHAPASRGRALIFALVAVLAVVEAAYWFNWTRSKQKIDSIAVLPLVNTTHDPGADYLSDGISESVINDLSAVSNVRVTAWTTASRYRQTADVQTLGRQLGVQAVLTGRLLRQGDHLIVQAELVKVRDGSHLWGSQYDRPISDLVGVQQQLSHDIANGLRMRLSGAQQSEIARRSPANPQAYELYLKGRFFWNRRDRPGLEKAVDYFQQAIAADPNYALAYAGLADCYNLMDDWGSTPPQQTFPKARAAALKALQLDDSLAEAHTSLAMVHQGADWDWAAAEREYKRAIELNPNYPTAHQWYAMLLVALHRDAEAEAQIHQAAALDPLSPIIAMGVGEIYNWEGKTDQAIAQYKKALELNPTFAGAWGNLSYLYAQKQQYDEAMAAKLKSYELLGETELARRLRQTYEAGARQPAGRRGSDATAYQAVMRAELQDELRARAAGKFADARSVAQYYADLHDNREAINWLWKAYQERSSSMIFVPVDPDLKPLHGDPEYLRLMDTLHLPH